MSAGSLKASLFDVKALMGTFLSRCGLAGALRGVRVPRRIAAFADGPVARGPGACAATATIQT